MLICSFSFLDYYRQLDSSQKEAVLGFLGHLVQHLSQQETTMSLPLNASHVASTCTPIHDSQSDGAENVTTSSKKSLVVCILVSCSFLFSLIYIY